MAAKPINPAIAELVLIDWRMGRLSQREIADKHSISKGSVGNLCKGIPQDAAAIVGAGIEYRQALSKHDGRMVGAIEKEVDKITRWLDVLHGAMMSNAEEAMATECKNQQEFYLRARTLGEAKTGIVGKSPTTAIQINNGPPIAEQLSDEYLASVIVSK
jgi:hypothetical protein